MEKIPYNIIIRLLKRVLMYADTMPEQEKTILFQFLIGKLKTIFKI